jgi:aldehyde dehydrogenase (NAD+)
LKFPGLAFAIPAWKAAGAAIVGGDRVAVAGAEAAFYVRPALVEIGGQAGPVERETFAPILYVIKYSFCNSIYHNRTHAPHLYWAAQPMNDVREGY